MPPRDDDDGGENSRARTLRAALLRLGFARRGGGEPLRVVLAGADRNEGADPPAAAARFARFAPLSLHLVGPNLVWGMAPLATFPASNPHFCSPSPVPGVAVTFTRALLGGAGDTSGACWRRPPSPSPTFDASPIGIPLPHPPPPLPPPPDVALCFHAGVWGYSTWVSPLCAMRCPAVVTAYCRSEAEADEDALRDGGATFLWEAEACPAADGNAWVPTAERGAGGGVCGEARAENAWWLCVAPAAA